MAVARKAKRTNNEPENEPLNERTNEPNTNSPSPSPLGDNSLDGVLSESSTRKEGEAFETFWQSYPRKAGKGAAQKSFSKAITKADIGTILAAVEQQKLSGDMSKDGEYIPYPAKWLDGAL